MDFINLFTDAGVLPQSIEFSTNDESDADDDTDDDDDEEGSDESWFFNFKSHVFLHYCKIFVVRVLFEAE